MWLMGYHQLGVDKVTTAEFLPGDGTKSEIHGSGIAQNFVDIGRVLALFPKIMEVENGER